VKHGISDDLYVSVYEGFTKGGSGTDVVLSQTLTEIRKLGLFSVETLELLRDTVNSGLSSRQHAYLRTSMKARSEEKIIRVCRYISLGADGAPSVPFATVTHVASIADSEMVSAFVSGPDSRIGIAHALLALRYSPPASGGSITEKLIERYPDMIRLFAAHSDRVIDMHEFIAERKLKLETADDFDQIREFLELDAPSLSSGLL
jgi:hypothetical protein